jgi:hypothetical protein
LSSSPLTPFFCHHYFISVIAGGGIDLRAFFLLLLLQSTSSSIILLLLLLLFDGMKLMERESWELWAKSISTDMDIGKNRAIGRKGKTKHHPRK